MSAVSYYPGCSLHATAKDYQESIDGVAKLLGLELREIPDWNCCGASHAIPRPDILYKLVGDLYDRALETGAQAIVVSCQMCQANLDMYQVQIGQGRGKPYNLPIIYFTELMGAAAGLPEVKTWLGRHFVDPRPLLGVQP
jgi:heterodisulfide reductase subunit B